jgi:hypothetical protein
MGFEPIIPAFEQTKTVHALDFAATVIGSILTRRRKRESLFVLSHLSGLKIKLTPHVCTTPEWCLGGHTLMYIL